MPIEKIQVDSDPFLIDADTRGEVLERLLEKLRARYVYPE